MVITGLALCRERKKSGVVQSELHCDLNGILGDLHYGYSRKQVSLLPYEEIKAYSLSLGHSCVPGRFGENIVIRNLPVSSLSAGDQLVFDGGVCLEITKIGAGGPASDAYQGYKVCVPMEPFFVFCTVSSGGILTCGTHCILKSRIF